MGVQIQAAKFQGYRRKAFCQIIVDGQDVTDRFNPFLISVQVIDNVDEEDRCNIELDDRNAELAIPEDSASVVVKLGWSGEGPRIPLFRHHQVDENGRLVGYDFDELPTADDVQSGELPFEASGMLIVFRGFVHNVESGFSRKGGGRRMWIEARGTRSKLDEKTPDFRTFGSGMEAVGNEQQTEATGAGAGGGVKYGDVLGQIAAKHGFGLIINPDIANIARSFWMQNESPLHFAERTARELGAQVKFSGGNMIVTSATSEQNADGESVPLIVAEWGVNLISWRIKPYVSRPQYGSARSKFFDIFGGSWDEVKKAIGGRTPFGMAKAITTLPGAAPNKQVGEQFNGGMTSDSELRRGTGWVIFNGEPAALAGHKVQIIGARPGVDGFYKIRQAEHNYIRTGGYTTRCDLEKPEFEGGYQFWKNQFEGKGAGGGKT